MKRPPAMLTAPWLISEAGAALVWAVYQRDWDGETIARARADRPAPYTNAGGSYAVDGDVAIVSVTGPIMRHGGMLADVSGATSDEQIRGALAAAAADPRITSVVLNLDSPGGEASGASDTADAIRALDAVKPVVAYVGGMAASKGYWFASAARQIVASRDAHLGSIGVRISLVDESAADQQAGTKRIEIVSGVSPDKRSIPVDDALVAKLQSQADDLAAVFVADVARGRKVSAETVVSNFGRGDVFIASKALAAGMVDEIGTIQTAITTARAAGRARRTMDPTIQAAATATAHAEFRSAVLAAFGTDSEAVALGKLAAGQDALATAAALRVELDGERQHTRKRAVKEALHAALHATPARINLGEIQRVIPTLLGSGRAEAMAALGKVEKQEGIPLVEALLSVPLSQDATDSVLAYLDARGPVHQAVEREPAPAATDPDDTDPVAMRIRAVAAETNKHFNLTAPATAAAK